MFCKHCYQDIEILNFEWVVHKDYVFCTEEHRMIYLRNYIQPINQGRRASDEKENLSANNV